MFQIGLQGEVLREDDGSLWRLLASFLGLTKLRGVSSEAPALQVRWAQWDAIARCLVRWRCAEHWIFMSQQ